MKLTINKPKRNNTTINIGIKDLEEILLAAIRLSSWVGSEELASHATWCSVYDDIPLCDCGARTIRQLLRNEENLKQTNLKIRE